MKTFLLSMCCLFTVITHSQNQEKEAVKQTIIDFFDAFHKQDTVRLKFFANDKVVLQTIFTNKEGKTVLNTETYETFTKSIASIPKTSKFEEKLLDFSIQIDGKMANAWTPYEFWFNGKFIHCGVNSFQLIKKEDQWKILYLVDTRRREGCSQ